MLVDPALDGGYFMRVSKRRGLYEGFWLRTQGDLWEDHFYDNDIPSYGVADSVDQFLEVFEGRLEDTPREYCVLFETICRDEQPREGGWRWCKNGEYFGKQVPEYEYLRDEPLIEKVVCFRVYRKKAS